MKAWWAVVPQGIWLCDRVAVEAAGSGCAAGGTMLVTGAQQYRRWSRNNAKCELNHKTVLYHVQHVAHCRKPPVQARMSQTS